MSTAIVSATIYDLNLYYKSNNNMPSLKASHFKTLVERKVIGTSATSTTTTTTTTSPPVGITNTVRRNSGQCCASSITNNSSNINMNLNMNNRTSSSTTATNSKNANIDLLLTNKLNSSLSALSLSNESLCSMTLTNNLLNQQHLSGAGSGASHRKLDRSMSEPVSSLQQQQQLQRNNSTSGTGSGQGNSSRYKTELCRPYEENGTCKYGDKCQFAHGGHELRNLARHPKYKTELCRTFHTVGFCPYGPRCHFIHNADESRKSCSDDDDENDMPLTMSTSPLPPQMAIMGGRPKAVSIGSFSMMTTSSSSSSSSNSGESPPSSVLSESPTTSLGSFFDDPFVSSNVNSTTANNAFTFSSQDFTSALMSPGKNSGTNHVMSNCYVNNNNVHHQHFSHQQPQMHQQKPRRNTMDCSSIVYNRNRDTADVVNKIQPAVVIPAAAPVPAASSCDLDDQVQLTSRASPPPTCTSPLDVSRNLRLPIFSQLSFTDD